MRTRWTRARSARSRRDRWITATALRLGVPRNRARRRRSCALAAEKKIAVPSSIRLLTGGLKGRWRQGPVVNRCSGCVWRPRPPRVGRAIPLSVTSVRGRRPVGGLERWWGSAETATCSSSPGTSESSSSRYPVPSDRSSRIFSESPSSSAVSSVALATPRLPCRERSQQALTAATREELILIASDVSRARSRPKEHRGGRGSTNEVRSNAR